FLKKSFKFHPLVLEELLLPAWRAKAEVAASYLFFIMQYPVYSKERRETRPRELDILVTKDAVITVHYRSVIPLKQLFDECNLYEEAREKLMESPSFLFFHIVSAAWKSGLLKLNRINMKIDRIEEKIFRGQEKAMVHEISLTKADIINFWRIVAPQEEPIKSLSETDTLKFLGKDMAPYFSDLLGDFIQTKNTLETYRETIQALEDTNNSLLNSKMNEIIKILTIFSVIVFPLTLMAAIFGMNTTYLPIVGGPNDFWIVSGIMATGTLFMITLFKKAKWL
ncbi:MAG: magnesium transporter CorA family protein, partial [Candidatus Pacearchaeota archaeon]|nr:magnesium transporter CorA family protein [Candidatus Pacearchaeota archaeon]